MSTEPRRLLEAEGPLSQALRELPAPPELTHAQVETIRVATLATASAPLLGGWLAKGWPLKLLVLGGVITGAVLLARSVATLEAPAVLPPPVPIPSLEASPVLPPPVPIPSLEPSPVLPAQALAPVPPPRVRAPARVEPVAPPPVPVVAAAPEPAAEEPAPGPAAGGESEEVRLLAEAHLANRERDAARALRQLEAYRARFPAGILSEEATLLEVEVRLASRDEQKALSVLNEALGKSTRRRAEFLLVRSELLARLGRCDEALKGFGALVEGARPLQERAWIGVATCQLKSGNRQAAAEALDEYLKRFPKGAQRALAIELLREL